MIKFTAQLLVAATYAQTQEYTADANQVELLPIECLPPTEDTVEQSCRPMDLTDLFPPVLFTAIALIEDEKETKCSPPTLAFRRGRPSPPPVYSGRGVPAPVRCRGEQRPHVTIKEAPGIYIGGDVNIHINEVGGNAVRCDEVVDLLRTLDPACVNVQLGKNEDE
jgi:hypothetical protein